MQVASGGLRADTSVLSERLWPESEGDAAKRFIDINLHRLRKILGVQDSVYLADGKLSLNPRKCWIDVWEFEALVARIEAVAITSGQTGNVDSHVLVSHLLRVYSG